MKKHESRGRLIWCMKSSTPTPPTQPTPTPHPPHLTLVIYDWKRCRKITKTNRANNFATHTAIEHLPHTNHWHYALQLSVYKYILQRKYGKQSGAYISSSSIRKRKTIRVSISQIINAKSLNCSKNAYTTSPLWPQPPPPPRENRDTYNDIQ
jgi:hypothetical protein